MSEVKEILNERAKTHGDFKEVAETYNNLRTSMFRSLNNERYYSNCQKLALDMICQKLARIKCGDANFIDHWQDIAGYATLVVRELEAQSKEQDF